MIKPKFRKAFETLETPFYFYDLDLLKQTIKAVKDEAYRYDFELHYAMKANNCEPVLKIISEAGLGADCVSGNEIRKAIETGFAPHSIAYAGVGKTDKEIIYGLEQGIFSFNCESIQELEVINELAEKYDKIAPVALRINPDVDSKTHKHISTGQKSSKFGIDYQILDEVKSLLPKLKHIDLKGIHFHIGSQITDIVAFEYLCKKVNIISDWFEKNELKLEHINVGGGLGVNYDEPEKESIPDFKPYFKIFADNLKLKAGQKLHFELGRSLVAQCGSFITRVLFTKEDIDSKYLIVDGGMSHFIRPMLYNAKHKIVNLSSKETIEKYNVAGPICESTDIFAKGIDLPASQRGDLLAFYSAGAYGQVMASMYNMQGPIKSYFSENLIKN